MVQSQQVFANMLATNTSQNANMSDMMAPS